MWTNCTNKRIGFLAFSLFPSYRLSGRFYYHLAMSLCYIAVCVSLLSSIEIVALYTLSVTGVSVTRDKSWWNDDKVDARNSSTWYQRCKPGTFLSCNFSRVRDSPEIAWDKDCLNLHSIWKKNYSADVAKSICVGMFGYF